MTSLADNEEGTPVAILVKKDPREPGDVVKIVYDTDDGRGHSIFYDLMPELQERYTRAGWAVRSEDIRTVEWVFLKRTLASIPDLIEFSGNRTASYAYCTDEEGPQIVKRIEEHTGQPVPVLHVYEYDPTNLAHVVLYSYGTRYEAPADYLP